ncbi:MAG: hypothetical protein AB1489_00050 [Acidobacteriota bacterium]
MSEARNIPGDYSREQDELETNLKPTHQPSTFNKVTGQISSQLEQLAGMIHNKAGEMKQGKEEPSRLVAAGERTAAVLNDSARYLKKADFTQMQNDLRGVIKRNPERSLLVGLGTGLLLGALLRKKG